MTAERKGGRRGQARTMVPAPGVVAALLDEAADLRGQAARATAGQPVAYWSGLADGIDHALRRLGLVPE